MAASIRRNSHRFLCSAVTQVEFLDDATLATKGEDGKTRLWSVGGDKVVEKETEGGKSVYVFLKESGREQRLRDQVVTAENELVLAKRADSGDTMALFCAPEDSIEALDCAGDKIAVLCKNGTVFHLRGPFLASE